MLLTQSKERDGPIPTHPPGERQVHTQSSPDCCVEVADSGTVETGWNNLYGEGGEGERVAAAAHTHTAHLVEVEGGVNPAVARLRQSAKRGKGRRRQHPMSFGIF